MSLHTSVHRPAQGWVRLLGAAVAAACLATPRVAHANTRLQASAAVMGGYDSNPLAQAQALAQGDFFLELRPGLILTSAWERAALRLSYDFAAVVYATRSDLNQIPYTNRLELQAYFQPSRTTTLLLSLAGTQAPILQLTQQQPSGGGPSSVTPAGNANTIGVRALEALTWDVSPTWRFGETATLNFFQPIDAALVPSSTDVDGRLSLERQFKTATLGAEGRVDYINYSAVSRDMPTQNQMILALVARGRKDLGRYFASQLDLGVNYLLDPDTGHGSAQPDVLAALRFIRTEFSLEASYRYSVAANVLVGQTFATHVAALRGSIPFGQKIPIVLALSAGYQRGRQVDINNSDELLSTFDLIFADATLTWRPVKELSIFARYQFNDQIGNPDDALPLPSFIRHLFLIGIGAIAPAEPAVYVPTRAPERADRSDEQTLPAAHSDAPASDAPPAVD